MTTCSGIRWTVPECEDSVEKEILLKLYKKHPPLGKYIKTKWNIRFSRELDITMDSNKFKDINLDDINPGDLPVYEGRMVGQYDSSQKLYISGNGRTAKWVKNEKIGQIRAHYYVENVWPNRGYRACYCDITGQSNVRTVLASLIKPEAVCGNKVPTCNFYPDNNIFYHLLWIGIANSFVVDWVVRKKITITLNYYHWNQIPFPRLSMTDVIGTKIAACVACILDNRNAYRLCDEIKEQGDLQLLEEIRKVKRLSYEKLRMQIDCYVAELYGLSVEELAYIMLDFTSIDNSQRGIMGDRNMKTYRPASYVTRDMLLFDYADCSDIDLQEIYARVSIDISAFTGECTSLKKRCSFYQKNGIVPYSYNV